MKAWAPLRHPVFRALWIAQTVSNVGTWMQTVGAQWLIVSLGGTALTVSLVQTATTLPTFLIGLPAGALGDILDRRRLMIGSQLFMLVCAALLGVLTLMDKIGVATVLALTFGIGLGSALLRPAWQAVLPELVDRDEIPQAATLNGVSMNAARAVGPAIGGVVVAVTNAGAVFIANAVSFLGVMGVLAWWKRPQQESPLGAEHVTHAIRVGARYVRHSPRLRAVLTRTLSFCLFSSALWALLPVVAHNRLGLGSSGYGLLLTAVGVGAIAGVFVISAARARWSTDHVVAGATLGFVAVALVLAWSRSVLLDGVALVIGGLCWIAVLSSLNASAQIALPAWVRARGMATYLLVFQGGQAIGSFAWGALATHTSTATALSVVAGGLTIALALSSRRHRLTAPATLDMTPVSHWSEPELSMEPDPHRPVLVTAEYRVPAENHEAFREAMHRLGRSRRRTGAERWGLYQDVADPDRFVENYLVDSWEEHLRQHYDRQTALDRSLQERAVALTANGQAPPVRHLIFAYDA
ncbi:MAG TPA: MFS transporter [Thermoleophilaceae bacterium]|nr:MFS transporter [Thermoleophilaceae bacterium]